MLIADGDEWAFEATPEEESELLEAIAGCERGETVSAEDAARAASPVTGSAVREVPKAVQDSLLKAS